MIKKRMKALSSFLIILVMMISMVPVQAAVDTTVYINKEEPTVLLTNEGERIFSIGYDFDVSFDIETTGLDLVIVLDRSNSMLRIDPSTNLPVAQAVWEAVDAFVTDFYTSYPESNVAIVSFGTNANKSDNWKYYDNLEDTLAEIEDVYQYRDIYKNYSSNFRAYYNNGYHYAWENWNITDGATNIAGAFEYAKKTVEMKETVTKSNTEDVIILFTDGVATQGGSNSQKNVNYPTEHNSNTIAAYEAGIDAQSVAPVITVGYFEGIEYESTAAVARETLLWAQNGGLFEAEQTHELANIFTTIVSELNYVGTNAKVTEVIEDEFEIVAGSIYPEDYTLSTDAMGRQVITWRFGNVVEDGYTFGYDVKVKDDVYPTGSGEVTIPINTDAVFEYVDLDGNVVYESLGHQETTIPPRSNQPIVDVTVRYDASNQVLVGDYVPMTHILSYTNVEPFDYQTIHVTGLERNTVDGQLSDVATIVDPNLIWMTTATKAYARDLDETYTAPSGMNLEWTYEVPMTLIATDEGTYDLKSMVEYQLTNTVGIAYNFSNTVTDSDQLMVRRGVMRFELIDNFGVSLTNIEVYMDGNLMTTEVQDQQVWVVDVPSGIHTFAFELPSGYKLTGTNTGINSQDGIVSYETSLNYEQYQPLKGINLERLNVKDIKVQNKQGTHISQLTALDESEEATVSFTLTRNLKKLGMTLIDDFSDSNMKFEMTLVGGVAQVRNSGGQIIPGFSLSNNRLIYEGAAELAVDTYTVEGVLTPPTTFGVDEDYDYMVYVNEITTQEITDPSPITYAITSEDLLLGLLDDQPPVIEPTLLEEISTTNSEAYTVVITDMTKLDSVLAFSGTYALEDLPTEDEALNYEITEDLGNRMEAIMKVPLELTQENDEYHAVGTMTIYARDAFGNESILVIEVDNDVTDLFDSNVI